MLDEAHCIKDRSCSTAQAVFKLSALYRWALSGTPLQNRVSELYSLVRFLQLDPYSYYYCNCAEGCEYSGQHACITATLLNRCRLILAWPDPDLTMNDTDGAGTGAGSCKSLNYDFGDTGKRCVECGHGKMNHYCWWNKHIANPIKHFGYSGPGAKLYILLHIHVFQSCLTRVHRCICDEGHEI